MREYACYTHVGPNQNIPNRLSSPMPAGGEPCDVFFQQNTMTVRFFVGGGNRRNRKNAHTCHKSITHKVILKSKERSMIPKEYSKIMAGQSIQWQEKGRKDTQ